MKIPAKFNFLTFTPKPQRRCKPVRRHIFQSIFLAIRPPVLVTNYPDFPSSVLKLIYNTMQ